MLIIALVLALIGLLALVFAVVTSNQLVAWVCIGASVLGVALLIVDALRERQQGGADEADGAGETGVAEEADVDYPRKPPRRAKPSTPVSSAVRSHRRRPAKRPRSRRYRRTEATTAPSRVVSDTDLGRGVVGGYRVVCRPAPDLDPRPRILTIPVTSRESSR